MFHVKQCSTWNTSYKKGVHKLKNAHKIGILSGVAVCTSFSMAITASANSVSSDSIFENLRGAILDSQEFMLQNDISWLNENSNIFSLSLAKYDYNTGEYKPVVDLFFAVNSFNFTSSSARYYIKPNAGTYRQSDGFTKLITDTGLSVNVESYRISVPYSLTGQNQEYWYFVENVDNTVYDYIITYCDIPEVTENGSTVETTVRPDQKYLNLDFYKYNNYFNKTDNNLTQIYNSVTPESVQTTVPVDYMLPPSWLQQTTATVKIPSEPVEIYTFPEISTPSAPAELGDGLRFWARFSTDVIERFNLLPVLLFALALALACFIIF